MNVQPGWSPTDVSYQKTSGTSSQQAALHSVIDQTIHKYSKYNLQITVLRAFFTDNIFHEFIFVGILCVLNITLLTLSYLEV